MVEKWFQHVSNQGFTTSLNNFKHHIQTQESDSANLMMVNDTVGHFSSFLYRIVTLRRLVKPREIDPQ